MCHDVRFLLNVFIEHAAKLKNICCTTKFCHWDFGVRK